MSETAHAERLGLAAGLLGHEFARPDLLAEALTHRSAAGGRARGRGRGTALVSNERLEFVGDRVLGLLIAEWLIERFPNEQEGQLGPRLALLVSREVLAERAEAIGYSRVLRLGVNEASAGVGRLATVLADAMEAAIGALYLDGGLETARRFVRAAWADAMESQGAPPKDPKTALQEHLLARGRGLPEYVVVTATGPSHAPHFLVEARGAGRVGVGEAGTKRAAERLAAADLLEKLT